MIEGKKVGVVIPAFNEEQLLPPTLAGIPGFVDRVIVVDDASRDGTVGRAHEAAAADPRIVVIVQERNQGVGAAVITGYHRAIDEEIDIVCVMNADNQMAPEELIQLVTPVAHGELDYAKANRLFTGEAWDLIPHNRYLGNAILSLFTKIASGYWHVADSQAGYTAISLPMLKLLDLDRIYPRYGYPERHARPPQCVERTCPRHPVPPDLRRRREVGDPAAQGDPTHLVAAPERVLLADVPEVRHPRLPPARLLLYRRLLHVVPRLPARDRRRRRAFRRATAERRHRRSSSRCC